MLLIVYITVAAAVFIGFELYRRLETLPKECDEITWSIGIDILWTFCSVIMVLRWLYLILDAILNAWANNIKELEESQKPIWERLKDAKTPITTNIRNRS